VPAAKPIAPELPHIALKRAKASRPPVKSSPTIALGRKPVETLVADASGHKKVRRGKLVLDARIDLHGMHQLAAHTALAALIVRTRDQNGRCILVVTGKGAPIDPGEDFITPQPGVIRRRLPEWLNGASIREHVAGFAPAHARDGGTGAFYVLLKRHAKEK
jgi:DNA-nicking Smr family endonuclease